MLHTRTPGIAPLLLEGVDEARGDKRAVCGADVGERVVSVWAVRISSVPIQATVAGEIGDLLREVAVRIDKAKSPALLDVLSSDIAEQSRLAGTGLPDDVRVKKSIGLLDAELPVRRPAVCSAEHGNVATVILHRTIIANPRPHGQTATHATAT